MEQEDAQGALAAPGEWPKEGQHWANGGRWGLRGGHTGGAGVRWIE